MMESLPDHIIEGCRRMEKPFYFQGEILFFSKLSFPSVLCIEIPCVCVAAAVHDFFVVVCLYQVMMVGCHKSFRQQAGFRFQNGQGQAVEPHYEVRFASVHDFVVGRKTQMDSLSHRIPYSTILLQLQS